MWRAVRLFLWQSVCVNDTASVVLIVHLCKGQYACFYGSASVRRSVRLFSRWYAGQYEGQYIHLHDSASVVKDNTSVFMTMHLCERQCSCSPHSASVWRTLRPFSLQYICIKVSVSVLVTVHLCERQSVRSQCSTSIWRTGRLFSW